MQFIRALAIYFCLATPILASDEEGRFAIKGAGAATCANFNEAWDTESPDLAQYGGWMTGYITASNLHFDNTYDLAPWQSTRTLLGYLRSACQKLQAETQIIRAVDVLMRKMLPNRLTAASELKGIRSGVNVVVMYRAVLIRVERALVELGFYNGPVEEGELDPATTAALSRFQSSRDLDETGVPDQRSLVSLFTTRIESADD